MKVFYFNLSLRVPNISVIKLKFNFRKRFREIEIENLFVFFAHRRHRQHLIEESEIFREYFSRCMCDDNGFKPLDGRDVILAGLAYYYSARALLYVMKFK